VDEWYTIERASKHLGVSTRTLRRWIKAGKLQARLEPGPYGRQYLVPRSSMAGVELVRDVERAERQAEREAVPQVLEAYLAQRESALTHEVAALRTEMQDAVRRLERRQEALLGQLEQIQQELVSLRAQGPMTAQPEDPMESGSERQLDLKV
jgi:excisionase family DNA binding protein